MSRPVDPPASSSIGRSKTLASDRWKILRQCVLSSSNVGHQPGAPVSSSSVMSFSSFRLFTVTQHFPEKSVQNDSKKEQPNCCNESKLTEDRGKWFRYKACINKSTSEGTGAITTDVIVKYISDKTSLETLAGFNNTGNVCIWPSEEVMAYYCLKNLEMFKGANICELGGGMTSLSGLFLASTRMPSKVLLTDGNQKSIDNLQEIVTANSCLADVDVSAQVILWDQSFLGKPSTLDSMFDYVLCADCLFFMETHAQLVHVIFKLLRFQGEALIFAPERSGTLQRFCDTAKVYFDLEIVTKYDDVVWFKHEEALRTSDGHYKMDIHYPIMILLKKRS